MRLQVLRTDDEILSAKTIDTNLARLLGEVCPTVHWGTTIDRESLLKALLQASACACAVIVNGGLGPDRFSQEMAAEGGAHHPFSWHEWIVPVERVDTLSPSGFNASCI
ncbi:MAG: hypothetical protein HYX38_15450 [Rhodospirillales bacterium]|nr:hypothetical protein [Rhodospirillales bacterium]